MPEPLDPAAIMADHPNALDSGIKTDWCYTCAAEWPCLPYRLAEGWRETLDSYRAEHGRLTAENTALREQIQRMVGVHARYFDLDGTPGADDTNPEPEDVWRFDRDFRAAMDGAR